jgi:hypothetical protein
LWLGLLALVAINCGPLTPDEWYDEGEYRWRGLARSGGRGPGFTQLDASNTGIEFSNVVTEAQMEQNRHLVQGSGVTLGDADGDSLVDIYFARIDGNNALYRNLGGWRFEDITESAGV